MSRWIPAQKLALQILNRSDLVGDARVGFGQIKETGLEFTAVLCECWDLLVGCQIGIKLCPTSADDQVAARKPNLVDVGAPLPNYFIFTGVAIDQLQ